jgi:hypothetical protein
MIGRRNLISGRIGDVPRRLRPRRSILTAGALATLIVGASFTPPVGVATAAAGLPALTITVHCYSNPERTVIHNNRAYSITITRVGSLYQPYSNEPFHVSRRLLPGHSVTYYTGNGATYANSNTLTRRYIYANTVGTTEGARIRTSSGSTFVDRC